MNELNEKFSDVGLHIPNILLPAASVELSKWPVIACDQYTSKKSYWENVAAFVGDSPSTYHLVLPEAYLGEADLESRITGIKSAMNRYLATDVFQEYPSTCVLVDRSTGETPSRKGLVIAVDLEKYDFGNNSSSLIRASEATIVERIPPRMKIRKGASCELPHILLLIDDPEKTVIEPLFRHIDELETLYDTKLMFGGGHIKGYALDREDHLLEMLSSIERLRDNAFRKSSASEDPLLFAVGDGNHSLATAKSLWEEIKRTTGVIDHPSRWALVELNNIYDEGMTFHPIHRVLFRTDPADVLSYLSSQDGVTIESRPSIQDVPDAYQ